MEVASLPLARVRAAVGEGGLPEAVPQAAVPAAGVLGLVSEPVRPAPVHLSPFSAAHDAGGGVGCGVGANACAPSGSKARDASIVCAQSVGGGARGWD